MRRGVLTIGTINNATAITHGGIFHADEVFATAILLRALGDVRLVRTFEVPTDVSDDVVVYDIGFGALDHHQQGGNGARKNGVPYAACGLVWAKYGPGLLSDLGCPSPEKVWERLDVTLIQGIDADDNGVYPDSDYPAQAATISKVVRAMNPSWDSLESSDEAFCRAVELAVTVLDSYLDDAVSMARAKAEVRAAMARTEGAVMVLDRFCPWQGVLLSDRSEKAKKIHFVVYPSLRGGYNWYCVPGAAKFEQRKSVPSEWRGASPESLREMTGVATATFCHNNGFMGACETLEDAIALAMIAERS